MIQERKNTNKFLKKVYRFCDDTSEVNWEARRRIEHTYTKELIRYMKRFVEESIRMVTYRRTKYMNALIGLSGGLDSTVAAYLIADAMQECVDSRRTSEANLGLINFIGLEDNDTKAIAENLQKRCPNTRVRYYEENLEGVLEYAQGKIAGIVKKLKTKDTESLREPEVFGELITRVISSILNGAGDWEGYATINTTNATEYILGEFSTGIGYDVNLLSGIYKSSVFAIGELLKIPNEVLNASPINSAFSFANKIQLYFGDVPQGTTPKQVYEVLDPILFWIHEQRKNPREIADALGHSENFVRKVKKRVMHQKHRQTPPIFLAKSKRKFFPNKTEIPDKEVTKIIKKSMLGECFER